jgi:hydroxymethylbilane synthase
MQLSREARGGRVANDCNVYPIALDIRNRCVLVLGAGTVAERKVQGLLEAGAAVRLVAPQATAGLRSAAERGALEWRVRGYESGDLEGARLVYAATDRPDVNAAAVADARARGIFACDTSGGESDFATPLAYRVGELTFAVDTGGSSPSFAKRLMDELRERFPERYGRAAATLRLVRDYVKLVVPAEHRAGVMKALAAREIDALAAMNPSTVENDVEAAYAELLTGPAAERPFAQLVCATRASALALWQTRHVSALLARAGVISTLLQISTKGDRVQDRSLAALGTDSIFVKELEAALREHRADYAVHSCKDLPSVLPGDMELAAIGPRADPRDAFCSERYESLEALPGGALVGTSSPRRRAQLQALRPDLRFDTIRGNVDTRLRKLREGEFDAILLAMAGLTRLGLRATYTVPLATDVLIPAVGQGALAIETRAGEPELTSLLHAHLADPYTEVAVRAERAFLRTLRGGCQAPVGAHAAYAGTALTLNAVIASPNGSQLVRGGFVEPVDDPEHGERLAVALAERMLRDGGATILDQALDAAANEPMNGAAGESLDLPSGEPVDAAYDPFAPAADDPFATAADDPFDPRANERAGLRGDNRRIPSPDEPPLAGRIFLLPRTQDRPSLIAPALRGAGAQVIEAGDSDAATLALGERVPHALLFPSSGSVKTVTAYLAGLRERGQRPVVAAMGEASSSAASAAGFPPDVVATEPTVAAFVQSVTQFVIGRGIL